MGETISEAEKYVCEYFSGFIGVNAGDSAIFLDDGRSSSGTAIVS